MFLFLLDLVQHFILDPQKFTEEGLGSLGVSPDDLEQFVDGDAGAFRMLVMAGGAYLATAEE